MSYRLCQHLKANGTACQSPALRTQVWCYFHARLHHRHNGFRYSDTVRPRIAHPTLPASFTDRASIQTALAAIIHALSRNTIDTRRASTLLYGLQLATTHAIPTPIRQDHPQAPVSPLLHPHPHNTCKSEQRCPQVAIRTTS